MKYKFIYTLVFTIAANVFAGSDTTEVYTRYAGSKALEFRMNGLFSLSRFKGGSLSYKSFMSKKKAFRVAVNIYSYSENDDLTFSDYDLRVYTDTTKYDTAIFDIKEKDSNHSFSIEFQLIKYTEPLNGISLCYGVGPVIGYERYHQMKDYDNIYFSEVGNYTFGHENIRSKVYGGVSTLVGVEWFFHKSISFHAEYHNSLIVGKKYENSIRNEKNMNSVQSEAITEGSGYYSKYSSQMWSGVSIYFK